MAYKHMLIYAVFNKIDVSKITAVPKIPHNNCYVVFSELFFYRTFGKFSAGR